MGIDKSLWDRYPSVIINGSRYHYGRDKEYGNYLVEHESIAKNYWSFKEKEDFQAFLINLPESGDRGLRRRLHPDWADVTPEQRDAYFEQDKLLFRAWADEKVKNGTAQSFIMDLEGKHGPYPEPQRIRPRSAEPPLDRLERQLAHHKAGEAVKAREAGYPIGPDEWPRGYTEALKLRVVEGNLDWTGVDARDKEAVLAREVNFAAITPEQFKFVYQDIASDKMEPADPAVAQALFDRSRTETGPRHIRDTTRNLVESVMLDVWPRNAAIVDFGIRSQEHYEALYYPLRNGDITPEQVDAAMGNGQKLSGLVNAAPHNPHKGIEFHTDWDDLRPEPANQEDGSAIAQRQATRTASGRAAKPAAQQPHPWPSEIAKANRQKQTGQDQGKSTGNGKANGHDDGHSM
jgi:hypothetical protein